MYISKSVKVTLWAGRLIALALVALMLLMPGLLWLDADTNLLYFFLKDT